MKILYYEEARYENGHKTGSLKVFIEDEETKKPKFWGYIPKEWVEAITDFHEAWLHT